jgi:hypothetical protein
MDFVLRAALRCYTDADWARGPYAYPPGEQGDGPINYSDVDYAGPVPDVPKFGHGSRKLSLHRLEVMAGEVTNVAGFGRFAEIELRC